MGLKYDYWPRATDYGMEHDPIVSVTFVNLGNNKSINVDCLVDSGADDILLHSEFAKILELDVENGEERLYQGIGGKPIKAFLFRLKMQIKGDSSSYMVRCAFMPDLKRAGLLGQKGFFDNYKVVFERAKKRLELTPL